MRGKQGESGKPHRLCRRHKNGFASIRRILSNLSRNISLDRPYFPRMKQNRKLEPTEELAYLREIFGQDNEKILRTVTNAYDVLQARSQLLLSLVAVVLTITGFSGPTIAASNTLSRFCIAYGLTFVLIAAVLILAGPLQLRWATQWRGENVDDSLINLIRRRNIRTIKYHVAFAFLVIGLSGYVGSVIGFLFNR